MLAMRVADEPEGPADETDGGRPKAARVRTCVATRTERPVGELIRFVVAPDGAVVPDLKAALPGRGVWVTAEAASLREAVRRRAFARGFKRPVEVPPDLVERVDALLADRAREGLALANKAGCAVTGFAKVEAEIGGGRVVALIRASEAAPDGADKLERRLTAVSGGRTAVFGLLPGAQLDLAFGRSNVVHAALTRGPAAAACLDRFRALARYRGAGSTEQDGPTGAAARGVPASGTEAE